MNCSDKYDGPVPLKCYAHDSGEVVYPEIHIQHIHDIKTIEI